MSPTPRPSSRPIRPAGAGRDPNRAEAAAHPVRPGARETAPQQAPQSSSQSSSQSAPELGEAETAVVRVLWDHGALTVREVMEHLHERGRKVAYTTVLTFLSRLEQKGVVAADKKGMAYVYRAKVSRDRVTRSRVRDLLEQLYDGAAGPVVMHLVKNEKLTADDITRLRRLIDELDTPEHHIPDGDAAARGGA